MAVMVRVERGSDEVLETVELFGAQIGRVMSWPPMAGRMLATLMLHDGPMAADELRESLQASAGAISEASRLLIDNGVVERVKTLGSRKRSYVYRDDAWLGCLRHQVRVTMDLLDLAESAAKSQRGNSPRLHRRFEDMRDYYLFMAKTFRQLEREFEATTAGRPEAPPRS